MNQHVIAITDATFNDEVLKSNKPVLIDFWAEWCGPCRVLAPVFEETAAAYHDKLIFAKINIDQNPETPSKYSVMSIPTLILFKNGQVEATKMGALSKSQLMAFIDSHI